MRIRVSNGSQQPVDLGAVVVTLLDSAQAPGAEMSGKPAAPFSGVLHAGDSADGSYVFAVDSTRRNPVSISVTLGGQAPVLRFTGDAGS